ncbi:hypothetical protein PMZ80_007415 [Knufia obscura]|uniref:CID domain-containing protein n=1 Tax=Knufia obscura TaxID=1635080 RepID=A0ABR0RIB6_9EURO|nr:hypothetical protein PMZ80_007415 [Knufia obscura]
MAEFPDIASKLSAPAKVSQFEKQKAEAEAKKAREKAETAAPLAEFEKSFDDEDGRAPPLPSQRGAPAPGKRHFTSTGLRSGPGSLGPAYNKKRPFEDYTERRDRGSSGFQPGRRTSRDDEERDEEKAAKPTLHLASMPPSSSSTFIKGLFAHTPLNVDNVRILPPAAPGGPQTERKSCSAIVTLAAETSASDIDTVVSHLQNQYLGFGFKLSISRHLSSAALGSAAISSTNTNALPFGARQIQQQTSLSRAPPPNQRFAPPASYTSSTPYSRGPPTQVTVQSPSDLKQLKLIHKTLESVLTYGPEFEALLMSRAEIQRDEKWAWLWDSTSVGGVYYRWRLWEVVSGTSSRRDMRASGNQVLFEGQSSWQPPEGSLRFEYTTQLDDFVSDDDYNSSDEESDDGGRGGDLARRYNDHNVPGMTVTDDANDGMGYLDPLAKAKLTHLLSRLPDSSSKLRRGDVARLTAFAIEHAGAGGDEVASLITRNVVRPFCKLEGDDWTSAGTVGLYVISDILSCSASAGVRHAWRYRTLFEQALRQQKVFEKLGRAEKDLKWGKLKGEKWKRSVQNLLSLWEGWSVFPQATQELFTKTFLEPPLTEDEKKAAAEEEARKKADEDNSKSKAMNRWRSVQDETDPDSKMEDVDGTPMADQDDEDMMSGLENIDGVSMVDSSDEEAEPEVKPPAEPSEQAVKVADTGQKATPATTTSTPVSISAPKPAGRRQRPKAADMFADDSS